MVHPVLFTGQYLGGDGSWIQPWWTPHYIIRFAKCLAWNIYSMLISFLIYSAVPSFLFHSLCSEKLLRSTGFRARRSAPPPSRQTLVSHPHFLLINFHNFHSKYCLYIFNKSVISIYYVNHRMIYFLSVWLTLHVDLHWTSTCMSLFCGWGLKQVWGWNRCDRFVPIPSTQRATSWLRSSWAQSPPRRADTFCLASLKSIPESRSPRLSFSHFLPPVVCTG